MASVFATPGIPTLYEVKKLSSKRLQSRFMKRLVEMVQANACIDPAGALRCYTLYRAPLTEEMLERVQRSR